VKQGYRLTTRRHQCQTFHELKTRNNKQERIASRTPFRTHSVYSGAIPVVGFYYIAGLATRDALDHAAAARAAQPADRARSLLQRRLLPGRTPKADVDVCFNGNIAVSQVKLL